jgi:spore photoproduct lyase
MKTVDDIRAVVYERGDRENEIVRRFLSKGQFIVREYDETLGPGEVLEDLKRQGVSSKEAVLLMRFKGRMAQQCPGSRGMICCNYRLLNIGFNCLYDCAYCFLNYYLNSYGIVQFIDIDSSLLLPEAASPGKRLVRRIGTGEYTDSLMLDDVTGIGEALISAAALTPEVFLEFKTKSDNVAHLLDIRDKGNTVLAWSVNTPDCIERYEAGTAPLEKRLDAAAAASRAGYLVAFHFDPIILSCGTIHDYLDLADRVFTSVDPDRVAWVSLGCFRYSPGFKDFARRTTSCRGLTSPEMFPCEDGKYRYFRPLRMAVYGSLTRRIRSMAPGAFVYFCMESESVWREVMGARYNESDELEKAFNDHLKARFL